jgi:monofunctional biosynthetic peptidoglycan transglycosylase
MRQALMRIMRDRRFRIGGAVVTLAAVAAGLYVVLTWPDVEALATSRPRSTAFIDRYRGRQQAAGRSDALAWQWVPWDRISPHLKRAVVSAEDMEFFSHSGLSTTEIRAAIRDALAEGRPLRGASTITQQLAKNLWLSPSRNPFRKLKELVLTRQLERELSKRRILELYLNVVEFGPGVYGAEAAARHYFGKAAAGLTEREAAQLAAGLPRPGSWHPGVDSPSYRRYVSDILRRMARADFLWRHIGANPTPLEPPEHREVPSDSLPLAVPSDSGTG